jgi:hypothetical protein
VITLISDDASLVCEFHFVDRNLKQFRFTCRIGTIALSSQWRTDVPPDSLDLIRSAAEANAVWSSIGIQTKGEYVRNKRGEPSRFPLPPEVYAKVKDALQWHHRFPSTA